MAVWEVRVAEEKRGAADKQRELLDLKADLNEKIASLQRQAEGEGLVLGEGPGWVRAGM